MKKKTLRLKKFGGLEYVTVTFVDCPVSEKFGASVPAEALKDASNDVSKHILTGNYAIRGKELHFIRKALGLSLRAVADALGISHPAIMEMEKADDVRIERSREAFLRLFFSERFGIKRELTTLSNLVPEVGEPEPIEIKAA